jgi:hypothetical protein
LPEENLSDTPKHQVYANIATIIASIAATETLILGYDTFKETSRSADHARAVDLLQKYYELRFEHEHLFEGPCPEDKKDQCESFGYLSIFFAESIFNLTKDNAAWGATVKGILCEHHGFLQSNPLPFDEYSPSFRGVLTSMSQPKACRSKT